ncbi:MAG: hypothetical protein ACRC3Y_19120, partial [Romboutsia sp.]|uniref:hypothetical protein n=1 Tax=Romboutsia sp. TaxID=1965302 RepID=UPI003F31DC38
DSHDIRLRAFVRCAKEEGIEKLAEYILINQEKGIRYGYQKDYDGLSTGDTEIRVKTGHIFCKHIDMTGFFTYFLDSYSLTLL